MSDELEKLGANMKNIQPSDDARKKAMGAALAAFDLEFSHEESAVAARALASEKLDDAQGLADAARPMEESRREGRLPAIGTATMTKLREIFKFNPQKTMMMGSCAAALMAALVILPNTEYLTRGGEIVDVTPADPNKVVSVPERPKEAANLEEPNIPAAEIPAVKDAREPDITAPQTAEILTPPVAPVIPKVKSTPEPQDRGAAQTPNIETPQPVKTVKAAEVSQTPSNVVTIERRVMKTPGSVQERVVPSVAKTEMRRRIKTPARTIERSVPAVTKQVDRRVKRDDGSFDTVSETVVVTPQSVEYKTIPAEYETVTETVMVQEAATELVTIPPVYETVRETIEIGADGSTTVLNSETVGAASPPAPASTTASQNTGGITSINSLLSKVRNPSPEMQAENRKREAAFRANRNAKNQLLGTQTQDVREYRAALQQKDNIALSTNQQNIFADKQGMERTIPAVTKQVARRVIKTPASTRERIVPAVTKEVTVEVANDDGSFTTVTKTFVIEPARTELVAMPPVYETVMETVVVQPGYVEPPSRDRFENYESNPVTPVKETPVSTFSIDVDTASYSFMRASLRRGQLPPPGAVRLEEMINYFPYDYKAPKSADEPFRANVTVTPTPWNAETKLMHIGIKGYVPPASKRPDSNIVLLIDTSGSMNRANKLPLLIGSFKKLLETLDRDDTVSIVRYAGGAGTVLEPTSAGEKGKIYAALDRLQARGSTAGAAGLELAYKKAQENFDDEAVNRVILATDGDFNVGFSSPAEMKTFIADKRKTGIFLSVLGFGMGNYNDALMQSLAQNGNGIAAYIDSLAEAEKVLADEAGSALFTIAKDVKIQVEFNPETVSEYRLIGYETRALKREDFNNDKVDAGEIGAGHSVTAIYELTPVSSSAAQSVDALRYASQDRAAGNGSDEFAFVKIRHKLPSADKSTLQTFPVGPKQERRLKRTSDDMRFAAAVAAAGQKLRGGEHLADFSYDDVIKLAKRAKGDDDKGYRAEFIELVGLMKELEK